MPRTNAVSSSPALSGLLGRCPACGEGKLFRGYIALPPACEACGLDYSFADSGDGPAVFVMLIAGFLALGFVLWFEFTFEPPFWVHLVVSLPVVLGVCLLLLRLFKGVLIALQHKHDAAEGRLTADPMTETVAISKASVVKAGVATAIALAILLGLGTWQLLRLKEKEALIARNHGADGHTACCCPADDRMVKASIWIDGPTGG